MRNFFLLWFRHYPRKLLEEDKNPKTLRNFNPYKKGLKKVPQRVSKTQGGEGWGSRPFGKNPNRSRFFLKTASLSIIYSNSNSHSYGIAKSLVISVAKAKLFPKLQLQAKLKTKLYLKTGLDKQLQIGGWWVTQSGK